MCCGNNGIGAAIILVLFINSYVTYCDFYNILYL